jgi:hypothetical protein
MFGATSVPHGEEARSAVSNHEARMLNRFCSLKIESENRACVTDRAVHPACPTVTAPCGSPLGARRPANRSACITASVSTAIAMA